MLRRSQFAILCYAVLALSSCNHSKSTSGFVVTHVDRQVSGPSAYPFAVDPNRVGSYSPDSKSGAGYFYDDVLEYRVWMNPENGADALNANKDYFAAFAQYEPALAFAKKTRGAEMPLVLVRQREWISEPECGHFTPEKGERLTEWQVVWLANNKRTGDSIREFLKHPREAEPCR